MARCLLLNPSILLILVRRWPTNYPWRLWSTKASLLASWMISRACLTESKWAFVVLASWLSNLFRYSTRRYLDQRTWRQRLTRKHQNWEPVIPSLMKLYADWKYGSSTTRPPSPMEVDSSTATRPSGNYDFSLPVLDIYTLDTSATIPCSGEELPITALVKNGYLGNTPVAPSLAISLKTLELFRRIQLHKSSFSVEAFTKVVCDLYAVCTYSS